MSGRLKEREDKIGRSNIVQTLIKKVDNLSEGERRCYALNGEWGSGKTWLLQEIENELGSKDECIVVKFDAWKNNFYPDPLIAMLYSIHDELERKCRCDGKLRFKQRMQLKQALKETVKEKANEKYDKILSELTAAGGWALLAVFVIKTIRRVIKYAQTSILDNDNFKEYKSYQKLLDESIRALNALTTIDKNTSKGRKLVILIDEIDRCLPREQVIVLERMHHLFDAKNTIIFVALNRKAVVGAINKVEGIENVNEYLEKFFDDELDLTSAGERYFANELNNILFGKDSEEGRISDEILHSYYCIVANFLNLKTVIETRLLERFFNDVHRALDMLREEKEISKVYAFVVIMMVAYKKYAIDNYNAIKEKKSEFNNGRLVDIFETYNGGLGRKTHMVYYGMQGPQEYSLQKDDRLRIIDYLVNKWVMTKSQENRHNIESVFEYESRSKLWNEELMAAVFDAIDKVL